MLKTIRTKNSEVSIIETSYLPTGEFSYDGSVGVLNTVVDLCGERGTEIPKTASAFIEKLKWAANYAFKRAKDIENADESDEAFIETFTDLIDSFDRLSKNPHFQSLLNLLGSSEDQFTFAFMADNHIKRRKTFLHLSWQMVGHLIHKHDETFYGMPAQRLKDVVKESSY